MTGTNSQSTTIVLIGPPGVGKSTTGKALARKLGWSFTDTDDLIAQAEGQATGEVFSRLGEPAFRRLEADVVTQAISRGGVISLGGGAVLTQAVRDALVGHRVWWLDLSPETAMRRTHGDQTRPVLASDDPLEHYAQLLAERCAFYEQAASNRIETDNLSAAAVAEQIIAGENAMKTSDSHTVSTIAVNGPKPYSVTVGHHLNGAIAKAVSETPARKVGIVFPPTLKAEAAVLADTVSHASTTSVDVHLLEVPDAEDAKTLQVLGELWQSLGQAGFGRSDLIIGFGGGAVTDLSGFLAATWMRGISVIHVPTSLLAMVDAAIGGKTGINTGEGKNLVGAFYEPRAVFVDLERLRGLPHKELVSGSAEIIKAGFIADPVILDLYDENPQAALSVDGSLPELIVRAITVKADVVSVDLTESGVREILNYGHTFGHAVELRENFRWRHGDAVAVGMVFVAELSHLRGLIDGELLSRHRRILASIGLPTTYPGGHEQALLAGMRRDKKNRGGAIRFVAIDGKPGTMTRISDATDNELQESYEALH